MDGVSLFYYNFSTKFNKRALVKLTKMWETVVFLPSSTKYEYAQHYIHIPAVWGMRYESQNGPYSGLLYGKCVRNAFDKFKILLNSNSFNANIYYYSNIFSVWQRNAIGNIFFFSSHSLSFNLPQLFSDGWRRKSNGIYLNKM